MRILILSFYFRPDLSACSFRMTALVDAMREVASDDVSIDVITTLPNRYQSFSAEVAQSEKYPGLSVSRIELPRHQSGLWDQSWTFVTFWREALRLVSGRRYDVVVATSSKLMTAVLGARIARRTRARLYLDLRDIFVENLRLITKRPVSLMLEPVFSTLERWAVKQASQVNLVSIGFEGYFLPRYPKQRFSYFTNGIDDEFLQPAADSDRGVTRSDDRSLLVVYAGNIGEGQGLHRIVPALARRMGSRVRFRLIGDGGKKQLLASEIKTAGVSNVELVSPVARGKLIQAYHDADVLFLHLNDYDAFRRVLPSKIFEYAAMGKPVWAGVAGYPAEFVQTEIRNAAVFRPGDVEGAIRCFDQLILGNTPRPEFLVKYARSAICRKMAEDILRLGESTSA